MKRVLGWQFLVAIIAAVALVAAACGDDGDSGTATESETALEPSVEGDDGETSAEATVDESGGTEGGETASEDVDEPEDVVELTQDDGRDLHIIIVSAPLVDPFFSAMEKGTAAAGADLRVKSEYTAPADFNNLENDFIRLMEAAISQNPDGIVIGNFFPDVQDPGIQDAIDAGIPVVVINSGEPSAKALGAVAFVGQDETQAGLRAGERMIANGVTNGLCMDHVPQNPSTTRRCEGFVAAFDNAGLSSTVFNLPLTDSGDPQAIAAALRGQLSANPDINGVFTLGSGVAESAIQAIADLGVKDTVTLGTSDLSTNVLNSIVAGDLMFASDQQPYLQGYYGVLIAVQYAEYGLAPSEPVRTGPSLITAEKRRRRDPGPRRGRRSRRQLIEGTTGLPALLGSPSRAWLRVDRGGPLREPPRSTRPSQHRMSMEFYVPCMRLASWRKLTNSPGVIESRSDLGPAPSSPELGMAPRPSAIRGGTG